MQYLFEYSDTLHSPYEAFLFDTNIDGFPIRSHWHYFTEFIYMLSGTALVSCDQESYVLEPGDFILFPPKSVHSIYTASNTPLSYTVLKFDMNRLNAANSYAPKLQAVFQSAKQDPRAPIYFPAGSFPQLGLKDLFFDCIAEVTSKEYGYDLTLSAHLSRLLIEIIRLWRRNGFDTDQAIHFQSADDSIHTITEYIDAHSHELISVNALAAQCHMSYSYFAKCFHQLYGQSCKEYIEFVKVCKVEDFLLFTDFDLSYISQETGFSDCSHLIKTFKKLRRTTPKQFRKDRRN